MTQLININNNKNDKRFADIIFVHGLDGDAIKTWKDDKNPEASLMHSFEDLYKDIGIWSLKYNASPTKWKKPSLPLIELSTKVLECCIANNIGSKQLMFICHSLGGLLIEQVLRKANDNKNSENNLLLLNTKSVIIFATPHTGSNIAKFINYFKKLFRTTPLVDDLESNNPYLIDLNQWYRNNYKRLGIITKVYYETRPTKGFQIVDRKTSDPGLEGIIPIPIETDHIQICKSNEDFSIIFNGIKKIFEEHIYLQNKNILCLRQEELDEVFKRIKSSILPINSVWIEGEPGVGKTYFAFQLAQNLMNGDEPIYIPYGVESNIIEFIEIIKQSIPFEFFDTLRKRGVKNFENIKNDARIEICIESINLSQRIVIVENASTDGKSFNSTILKNLVTFCLSQDNVRLILTTYSVLHDLPPNQLKYHLQNISLDDSRKLIKFHRQDITDEVCDTIYNTFTGHTLSIASWAISKEPYLTGLPSETINRYLNQWSNTSEESKRIFICLCDYPELANPKLIDEKNIDELLHNGLLSMYPIRRPDGVTYYIHQVAKNACYNLFDNNAKLFAIIELLQKAVQDEIPLTGPKLLNKLLELHNYTEAEHLIVSRGRDWLESSSINFTKGFLLNIRLKFISNYRASFYCKYLECLSLLFSGMYKKAMENFTLLIEEADKIGFPVLNSMKLEILECQRRLGNIEVLVNPFSEIVQYLQTPTKEIDEFNNHFLGVSYFIVGHFFRSFNNYSEAYKAYEKAEKIFLTNLNPSNRIEALHCAYSKSLCTILSDRDSIYIENYSELIYNTNSNFLKGLFHLVQARINITLGKLTETSQEIQYSKKYFRDFGSPIYYHRSLCYDALLSEILFDTTRSLEIINEVKESPNLPFKINLLVTVIDTLHSKDKNKLKTLSSSIKKLLTSGSLTTVFSILCLYRLYNIDCSSLNYTFTIKELIQTNQNVFFLQDKIFNSINDLYSYLQKTFNIYDEKIGVFFFD